MLTKFFSFFDVKSEQLVGLEAHAGTIHDFLNVFGGMSFGNGLYRLHRIDDLEKWDHIILEGFPEFKGRITCFGYDWLGRQFAIDHSRIVQGQPQIIMFEPGTGEALEIPCSFIEFHEEEIPNYHNACLASEFFKEWISKNPVGLMHGECAGYKVPLFLGGADSIENLEKSDLEVYWGICTQLTSR